jgi:hypothetical protein
VQGTDECAIESMAVVAEPDLASSGLRHHEPAAAATPPSAAAAASAAAASAAAAAAAGVPRSARADRKGDGGQPLLPAGLPDGPLGVGHLVEQSIPGEPAGSEPSEADEPVHESSELGWSWS